MLPKEIDVQGAAAWLQAGEAILIDVREVEEYRRLRIPGAALLALSAFNPSQIPPLDGKKLLIHCAMGGRSRDAVIRCRPNMLIRPRVDQLDVDPDQNGPIACNVFTATRSIGKIF